MLTVAFMIAGWIAFYVVVRITMEQNSARLRQEFQRELVFLTARVRTEAAREIQPSTLAPGPSQMVSAVAAATAALGATKVHIRPARPQAARTDGDLWAQHGRAGVWSSHDIAQRWH
jgi:acetylornithine deacetylase/succinyl-diaminopimelate desuccinylase-like protein